MTHERDFITVVSGLPRSGTSMMMRMLENGGLPLLTDGFREADEDNLLGYYEFEPVKRLDRDSSWLTDTYGKAVKIIYVFLYNLPRDHRYKILFMKRSLDEVIASQKIMLRRRDEGDRLTDQQLIDAYNDQLKRLNAWIQQQDNVDIHYLDYNDVVAQPARAVSQICQFLGLQLDAQAMVH